ncbi:MAG TPA: hypothetical protein VH598_11360, partial [Verrucomicrobiae bacterium]|nr:hypothetical protein [Verrucomicrobiae bacterium]
FHTHHLNYFGPWTAFVLPPLLTSNQKMKNQNQISSRHRGNGGRNFSRREPRVSSAKSQNQADQGKSC